MIEVKGGGISFEAGTGEWFSTDAANRRHVIKNPFWQGRNAKHQILAALRRHGEWFRLVHGPICIGHAVWLPDIVSSEQIIGPDRPRELILTFPDLNSPELAVRKAWAFSGSHSPERCELGRRGVDLVEAIFAREFSVRPSVAARIAEEESVRIELTDIQFRILKMLGPRRRVGICGGAGTGKTLLALEKAQELGRRGFKTLLLAFNRPLGDHLAHVVDDKLPITASSFHVFCTRLLTEHPGDYLVRAQADFVGKDHWNVIIPGAICYLLEDHDLKFDAILVDEAQDFADEFWFPLECMMADAEKTPLYLFYDPNQQLYRKSQGFPIKPDDEFVLTENCRNTARIHEVVKPLFSGSELSPSSIQGTGVGWHLFDSHADQIKRIKALVSNLALKEAVSTQDIVVLVARRQVYRLHADELLGERMSGGIAFVDNNANAHGRIRVLTAAKFKGLEASVVIVWGLDGLAMETDRMDLYVAFSRAKNELHIVANQETVQLLRSTLDLVT